MTVQTTSSIPVSVQSSKIIEWMLNRRLLQNDYPKRLASVRNKLQQLISADLSVLDLSEHEAPSYLQALQISEIMEKSDTRRDFFGRASQSVRSWKDIVDTYEKHNLHIAEISEKVQEIAAEQVPRCRFTISDRQKLITDLRQKVKEQTLNVMKKEEALEKACKEFGINASEANIKLRLLEESTNVPSLLTNFVESLSDLTCVVDLYAAIKEYTHRAFQDEQAQRAIPLQECCPTLSLLIKSGHVHLFTWKMGCEPGKLGADDDFIPTLLAEERRRVQQPTVNLVQQTVVDEAPVLDLGTSVDIEWGDIDRAGIDFDVIEVEEDAVAQIELDEPVQTDNTAIDTNISEGNLHEAVVSGHMARFLLDTIEGRAALLNELVELSSFLTRFTDDLIESQGLNRGDLELADSPTVSASSVGNYGGSSTIHNMIMQNSPSIVQSVSAKEAANMLTKVERARAQLTNSSISQLLMIRSKPGYLDRLVGRLTDLRLQVERAKARVAEAQSRIDEASAEQEIQAGALVRYRSRCKQLVQILETELTKICNRQIQIIGQVLDM
ncbi:CDK5 regulatory subunit-associated protein 3 [Clonorchis sinensis]|uniref:CDK5 regulatory subunit-associated protein 3 n=1 Tax=Clonorchis sinensis TaxID=79923 RepID=A0A8T1M7A5_CLOSI|nr:CDK5 regulatory subunit-associated protein 3 [Clonorchis sinensis]